MPKGISRPDGESEAPGSSNYLNVGGKLLWSEV